ncbi:hypothetical protein [Chitinophaga sp. CB10]|uniref:hypothetical protein n=1 Tax=Chitinophaga sp. CB10 TaxID=1891659 RepID=UPI0025C357D0|nr:hypothetical protein [Chitinophaga sp. CB10]
MIYRSGPVWGWLAFAQKPTNQFGTKKPEENSTLASGIGSNWKIVVHNKILKSKPNQNYAKICKPFYGYVAGIYALATPERRS